MSLDMCFNMRLDMSLHDRVTDRFGERERWNKDAKAVTYILHGGMGLQTGRWDDYVEAVTSHDQRVAVRVDDKHGLGVRLLATLYL